jgi:hypothetical protein
MGGTIRLERDLRNTKTGVSEKKSLEAWLFTSLLLAK